MVFRFILLMVGLSFTGRVAQPAHAADCRTQSSRCELVLTIRELYNGQSRNNLHEVFVELNEAGGFASLQYFKNRARWTDRIQGGTRVDEDGSAFFESRFCTIPRLSNSCELLNRDGRRIVAIDATEIAPQSRLLLNIQTTMWWLRGFSIEPIPSANLQAVLTREGGHWHFTDSEGRRFHEIEMRGRRAMTGGGVQTIRAIY